MKFILNSFFILLFFISSPVYSENFYKKFSINVSGLKIGELVWVLEINDNNYTNDIKLKSRGLLSTIYTFEGEYFSKGIIENNKLKPHSYNHIWKTNKAKKTMRLSFEKNMLKSLYQVPYENEKLRILSNLNFLKVQNLFFLERFKIKEVLTSDNSIDKLYIFKKYPSTLEIRIIKTEVLANILIDGSNYLVGLNGKLIKSNSTYKDKPFIYGEAKIDKFIELRNKLEKADFDYMNIKNFYFFNSERWDLEMKDGMLIKLPQKEIDKTIKTILEFLYENDKKNISIIDARINNQIIING